MRNLLFAAMFIFSTLAAADEFKLEVLNDSQIKHNSNDWVSAATTSKFELYVNTASIASADPVPWIHSLVEFYPPDGAVIDQLGIPIKRIYSRGIMECKNGILHLSEEYFVDKNNNIVYTQIYEFGQYAVDVSPKNTPRNDLFLLVCTPKS